MNDDLGPMKFHLILGCALACLLSLSVSAQQAEPQTPVVVQPGAPGQPTKTLPLLDAAHIAATSPADVQFMQHMIMHHAQAVEMTALIDSHTENKELRSLGARISRSQSDEIKFMKRWLAARGEPASPPMHTHARHGHVEPSKCSCPACSRKADGRVEEKQRAKSLTICS